jgi:methionyl aminopeptidase
MTIEGVDDLDGLRRIGAIVAEARDRMLRELREGVTTAELDEVATEIFRRTGARSAPKLAYDFPGATCISVNDAVAHGIPSTRTRLRAGDLVNIDVSAELDGYWADTGASAGVGRVSARAQELVDTTRRAQREAMQEARAGRPLRNIGRAVERRARKHGFRVIGTLGGHGVGRNIHEEPHVANTYDGRDRTILWEGLVITVEPFLTTGATTVYEDRDGWTLRTPDRSLGAQFEHTLVVTHGEPIVLT